MKVMILAAGFGTRLFPLTIDRTKPAIPFLGKPLVAYVAEYVAKFGFRDFVVNLHHQPESVRNALGDGSKYGVNIEYALETPEILGTSGALDNARDLLMNGTVLIINGKIISEIDIAAAAETHRQNGAIATMVLKPNIKREKFTEVEVKDGMVTRLGPHAHPFTKEEIRDTQHEAAVPLMFTGIHFIEPEVFEYFPRGVYSDIVQTFYLPAIKEGGKVAAHVTDAEWFELSTIPRYLDISLAMMKDQDVFLGRNCKIDGSAHIRDSVLWDDISIGKDVNLYRTIVADDVNIPDGSHFENAAIVSAEMVRHCEEIPDKALKGYIQDENYIVPLN
jgi:NDP-sugar pyrophosphorylase family protein